MNQTDLSKTDVRTSKHRRAGLRNNHRAVILCSILLAVSGLIYLPGINGPFVFDDLGNILNNDFVKIRTLDAASLHHAAYSLQAGPLQRPIAMASFALNYYFADGFASPTPYKLTNLAIHVINGLLVFWLLQLMLRRATEIGGGFSNYSQRHGLKITLVAAGIALLWTVHPIQLTSVLYVVQRMTEFATLFTFLALVCYMKGRARLAVADYTGTTVMFIGCLGFGVAGLLSKESAALLPIFALLLEFTLFPREWPWRLWSSLPTAGKRTLLVVGLLLLTAAALWALDYASPGYRYRPFTLLERVMTEWRVLFFYLSLIVLPRIHAFGLQHDDIAISTSLFTPWTTLPSLVGLLALVMLAVYMRRRHPLLCLGILWFFVAHSLESTIFGLEIAHEHRNYLASLGPIMVMVYLIELASQKLRHRKFWVALPLLLVITSATTILRADQWSDSNKLYRYEALHHPDSARAQAGLAALLSYQGQHEQAIDPMHRAAQLDPLEPGYLMMAHLIASRAGKPLATGDDSNLTTRLVASRPSAYANLSLQHIGGCIQTNCTALQPYMERWLTALIEARPADDVSFYYNLLGRTLFGQGRIDEAMEAFERSYEMDPVYMHPLFELANVYTKLGKLEEAHEVLGELRQANKRSLHPRDREIAALALTLESLKNANIRKP